MKHFLLILLLLGCMPTVELAAQAPTVQYAGTLRAIMKQGDLSTKLQIDALRSVGIYGLGPATNLDGEWVIWDGQGYHSYAREGKLITDNPVQGQLAMGVWANMNEFVPKRQRIRFKSLEELERKIALVAHEAGIDTNQAFPFLLEGRAVVHWHVIHWPLNNSIHTHEKHQKSGLNGKRRVKNGRIIGFYSAQHAGIFTHHSTRLHLHLLDLESPLAAHIDKLKTRRIQLSLPVKK